MRLAAVAVGRTDTALGAFYRRLSSRIGSQAVTATARKVAVLFYNAVRHRMEYVDPGASSNETRIRVCSPAPGAQSLLHPITLYQGKVLDGRNRERACRAAGVEPGYVEFEGKDPAAFVISQNLARRHLGPSERAMVAARMANLKWGQRSDSELCFPRRDLVRVDVELLRQLSECSTALEGGKRHLSAPDADYASWFRSSADPPDTTMPAHPLR